MNPFLHNIYANGSASTKQLNYLQTFINRNGLKKFREYRDRLKIQTPLHRLSGREAWQLIHEISKDAESKEAN